MDATVDYTSQRLLAVPTPVGTQERREGPPTSRHTHRTHPSLSHSHSHSTRISPSCLTVADPSHSRSAVGPAAMEAAPGRPDVLDAPDANDAPMRAAEELVTTLAHDLNNHLTALLLLFTRLSRRARQEQRVADEQDTARALRVSARLQALVGDLLDTARLRDGGVLALSPEPVELGALLRQCAALFETGDHPIALRLPASAAPAASAPASALAASAVALPVVVQGDPGRLRQVIENLLANAMKHSPSGAAVTLSLEVEHGHRRDHDHDHSQGQLQSHGGPPLERLEVPATPPLQDGVAGVEGVPGRQVCIAVSDQGPGIAPQLLPHIFERFVVGPQSHGLGLGLYLARAIARAHGGELTVHSRPGAGARFALTLPLAPSAPAGAGPAALA